MHGLPEIGDVIDDTYEIISKLGAGGFGAVFLANHIPMDRQVALKMLLAHGPRPEEMVERFRREVMATRVLTHPNTVRIFDFRDSENHLLYYTMEYLRGDTLKGLVKGSGAQSPKRVKYILRQVLKSLSEAHSYGIIHRDLKPANIMLVEMHGETDFVKVLDFGIAKILDTSEEEDEDDPLTSAGMLVGTLRYMAPEQIMGAPLGPMTDLYSLGLITAELLVGKSVFAGTGRWEVFQKQISEDPIALPLAILNSPMGPFLQKALNKNPELRYPTATDMLKALDDLDDSTLSSIALLMNSDEVIVSFGGPDTSPSESSQAYHSGAFSNSAISVSHLSNPPSADMGLGFDDHTPTIVQDVSEAIPVHVGPPPFTPHGTTPPAIPLSPKTIPLSAIAPVEPPTFEEEPVVADPIPQPTAFPSTFPAENEPFEPAPNTNKKPILFAIAGVALLAIIGAGAAVAMSGDDKKDPVTPIAKLDNKATPPKVDTPKADNTIADTAKDGEATKTPDESSKTDTKAVKTRTITINSSPKGAEVKLGSLKVGTTPFEYTYSAPVGLTVELKDHKTQSFELTDSSEDTISLKMVSTKKVSRKTPKTTKKTTSTKTTQKTTSSKTTKTTKKPNKGFIFNSGSKTKKNNGGFAPMN